MIHLSLTLLVLITSTANISSSRSGIGPRSGATSSAQDNLENYLSGICNVDTTNTRPCEALAAIQYQCITGLDYDADGVRESEVPDCYDRMDCQSDDFQRTCFCQSQFLDNFIGCIRCYLLHSDAASNLVNSVDRDAVSPAMDEYCDPMVEPTTNFGAYLQSVFTTPESTSTVTKWSDPLGFSKTDVSLYYTPSMTGVEAWATTLSKIADWSEDAIETSGSSSDAPSYPTDEYTPRATTFTSNSRSSIASTETVGSPTNDGSAPTGYPPIFIQPVYPTTTTRVVPLPSLVTDDSASHIIRIRLGCVFGGLSLVAILLLL